MIDKYNIIRYDTIGSTNTELYKMAIDGAKEWTVVIANEQTAGKGRMGRSFESPMNTGVYMSILLRPTMPSNEAIYITVASACAAAKAIEDISNKKAEIKWVNDIFVNDKKVCGILAESQFTREGNMDFVILGIGVNIFEPINDFSSDVKKIAGGILESGDPKKKDEFVEQFLKYFSNYYETGLKSSFEEYKNRSYLIGHDVEIIDDENKYFAHVVDIDDKCGLVIKDETGKTTTHYWGSMRIRRI
ncbi:MAG: biotin--[acetyl-CoA-carboxylase] ligase [Clostridia bacterium]|nr:biotin--[acetyl-CoA-carboxylase] ligase [Clostridia bacterium]